MRHCLMDLFCGFVNLTSQKRAMAELKPVMILNMTGHCQKLFRALAGTEFCKAFILQTCCIGHVPVDSEKNYSL